MRQDDFSGADLLQQVAGATALREGAEGVAQVLRIVYAQDRITLKDLSRQSGLPVPVLAALRGELEKAQLLERRAGIALTETGRRFVQEYLQVTTRHDPLCPTCRGKRILVQPDVRPAVQRLEQQLHNAPSVDVTLDQAPCLAETSIRRALTMYHAGALEGKAVILLGDDDLVSVAIGLLGQTLGSSRLALRLTVLDADPRWIGFIESVAQSENLQIECVRHDLRDPLPEHLRAQFDTFETDPPYTRQGIALFVSRAVSALKPGDGGHGFLSCGPKSPAEMLEIQQDLSAMGLVVHEVTPAFNEYSGASILGGSSQMIHLLATRVTRPLLPDAHYGEPIHTGAAAPTTRLYVCTQCKTRYRVGQGHPFVTIESLKAVGCGECGNASFRYVRRVAR